MSKTKDTILTMASIILGCAFGIAFWVFFISLFVSDARTQKEERIERANVVREFVEDKSIIEADIPYRHILNNGPGYDMTITVMDSDGNLETKTFEEYKYAMSSSTDEHWHIDVTSDGYITVYTPLVYTSK